VGNKIDLEKDREISYEEALEYAKNIGVPYVECSAKNGQNVN
jgi:GTPase SAR1 family protein